RAKPVALVADAIRDCARRGDLVLDSFGGSGTTLIACERTNRQARLIELDPIYCDQIVRRWQKLTGRKAVQAVTGVSFDHANKSPNADGRSGVGDGDRGSNGAPQRAAGPARRSAPGATPTRTDA